MARRHSPNLNWEGSGFYFFRYLESKDRQNILQAFADGNLTKDEIIGGVQNAIRDLCANEHFQSQRPTRSQIKAALNKIYKAINKPSLNLMELLGSIDRETISYIEAFMPNQEGWTFDKILSMIPDNSAVSILKSAVQKATEKIKISGGRPASEAPLRQFIQDLAILYERHTGDRPGITYSAYNTSPYSGNFFNLVCISLNGAGDPRSPGHRTFSNEALGKQIQRALKSHKSPA